MTVSTPRLELFPDRVAANAAAVVGLCHGYGVQVAGVAKVVRAEPAIVDAMLAGGVDLIADSRLANLAVTRARHPAVPLLLLRPPDPRSADEVVAVADMSLVSGLTSVTALGAAARDVDQVHQVVVMVDLGDLREGLWPDEGRVVEVVSACAVVRGIEVVGVGTNLACYGGVVPTAEAMRRLLDVRDACRAATGLELPVVSGGNSSALPLLASGQMPHGITSLRVGEAIMLGRNVLDRSPWPGTRQDTARLVASIVEIERKPSVPVGLLAQNAFGETPVFVDRGVRWRAIVDLGRQDVAVDGITPHDEGVVVLGASSDHLILDVDDLVARRPVCVGDEIAFDLGYAALLAAATSPYVQVVARSG